MRPSSLTSVAAPIATALLLSTALPALAIEASTVSFDHGREGWTAPRGSGGRSGIVPGQGNDAPALRTHFDDFGITFANRSNGAFVGDYTSVPALQISLDVKTLALDFFGSPVTRELIVELRDHDGAPDGYPYVSVWATLGTLDAGVGGWQTWSVTIADTSATALPAGWGGYGAEDPVTAEPMLPPGRSFANVLAGVDEIAFTTLVPGYFYGDTLFDVAVDNIRMQPLAAVPEAPGAALMAAGLLGLAGAARLARRRRARIA